MISNALSPLDWLIVLLYLGTLATVGVYFSRRQTGLSRYLLAERSMAWLPVGLSLMAALNSGIDYLTQPSATIRYGLVLVVGTFSWIPLYFWVSRVAVPFFHRLEVYTAYEYLETRFDVSVRVLAALIFVIWRLGWMATALYIPCLAINAATSGAVDLTTAIIVLGVLVTTYTMLGGIQAVIWNDVMQFCVMFGGLAATMAIVLANVPGGASEVWTTAAAAGKTSFWVPITNVFTQPVTVPALLFALIVGRMAQYTSDQVMVQRLQTTRSVKDARQAFVIHAAGDVLWMVGLSFVGLSLLAYLQHEPMPLNVDPDRVLPYFMATAFPVGAVGLVIAAILAASLSSIDSAIHACSSVLVVDFYHRLFVSGGRASSVPKAGASRPAEIARSTAASIPADVVRRAGASAPATQPSVGIVRIATVIVGAAGTTLATNVAGLGNLLEIANKLINSFSGPLFGIFILAMFSARTSSLAALLGGMAGAVTSYLVAYHSGLSFLWPSTFGLAATLLVGAAMTVVAGDERGSDWTWRRVMQRARTPARSAVEDARVSG